MELIRVRSDISTMQKGDPIKQFRLAVVALVALAVLGTFGYHILMDWTLLDSFYMTVITLATVGYREMGELDAVGQVFTISLIVFGVTIVFWAGASLVDAVVGERVWHVLQRKKMDKHIAKLREHYIICGFGRTGHQIVKDLRREGVPHVVIEKDPEQLPELVAQDTPFVEGNASDDKALQAAGIEHAKGLITVATSDEDNVFITLSARKLNPDLFIVARSILEDNEDKLRTAGADRVISPYVLSGRRMTTAVLRPNVWDFLQLAVHTDDLQMVIEELAVGPGSPLVGKTIEESDLKRNVGVTVIAIKTASGIVANPPSDKIVHEGDVLIVLGTPKESNRAQEIARSQKSKDDSARICNGA